MSLLARRRAMMGQKGGDVLTPVTALISSHSYIDTGIIVDSHTIMTIRAKRPNETNKTAMFSDGQTYLTQSNTNYSYASAFGLNIGSKYVKHSTIKDFIIDGVNHQVSFATNSSNYDTVENPVYPTLSMMLGTKAASNTSNNYTFYYVQATVDGVLAHDLRPYLKNGKPGFLDVITKEFHTIEDGGEDWTYEP